jgi:hypothetical protein
MHTGIDSLIDQKAMEVGAAHTNAIARRKAGFDGLGALAKTDPQELVAGIRADLDAKRTGSGEAIGHDAFAASFIDRNLVHGRGVSDHHFESAATGGDGGGQTCGATADDENVCGVGQGTDWRKHLVTG